MTEFVWPTLQAGARYQGVYPLATAIARPLIARLLVEVAHEVGARSVAHGCTGKGNDQVRFDVAVAALDPTLSVIAPMRVGMGMNRDEELAYARAHGIEVDAGPGSPFSIDLNLWGRSVEAGVLEDPWAAPPPEAYAWTVDPADAPREAHEVVIGFASGIPVSLDGHRLDGPSLIDELNRLGGAHGVGRIDHIEDRLVGIKSREVYEAPAAVVLHLAHDALESLTLSRELLAFKRQVADRFATLAYDGLWYSELARALRAFTSWTQRHVTGEVRVRLTPGTAQVVGRRSPTSLYDLTLASYGAEDSFDHEAAVGFITLWGLPIRTQSAIRGPFEDPDEEPLLARLATERRGRVPVGAPVGRTGHRGRHGFGSGVDERGRRGARSARRLAADRWGIVPASRAGRRRRRHPAHQPALRSPRHPPLAHAGGDRRADRHVPGQRARRQRRRHRGAARLRRRHRRASIAGGDRCGPGPRLRGDAGSRDPARRPRGRHRPALRPHRQPGLLRAPRIHRGAVGSGAGGARRGPRLGHRATPMEHGHGPGDVTAHAPAKAAARGLSAAPRHFLSSTDLDPEEQARVLTRAASLRDMRRTRRRPQSLANMDVALLFEKPSLRTRVTFDLGITQLGGRTVYLGPDEVGIGRRETATDVGGNLSRWVDGIVFRTFGHTTLEELAAASSVPVVNALSDREHPCQALADLLTLQQHLGALAGRRLAFVGDGNNVCHSLLLAGAQAGLPSQRGHPAGLRARSGRRPRRLPRRPPQRRLGRDRHRSSVAVREADAVYTDTWTSMGAEAEADLRRLRFAGYRVDATLLAANPDALVMHCLPAHRGEEISDEALDGATSVVLDQAENRLYVQQALLVELLAPSSA